MSDANQNHDKKFQDPNIAINRVYTRKGDAGTTRLVGGQKVMKSAARIETYGTVDELNAVVGAARQTIAEVYAGQPGFEGLSGQLFKVQHQLFNLGSVLATLPEDVGPMMPRVDADDVAELEALIDQYNQDCPPLRSFVLPGGTRLNVELHLARTVCRRAERLAVGLGESEEVDPQAIAYLNRLSDAFFVWSRWASIAAGSDEVLWDPNV
ncbi:cob(I)yrinic acid a,c-diamide adenosyltransferase [Lujinxingia litoralis]|uniref:Corrinoid adenosyltransferase n=1 Tax=Lujinxingia litoralis TaxID=2211119 RepID=A0A328C4P3_9DELT|nr:cob(I)yrinic acid a,c-diamide adenosyltransferase [Lujinxingia litoralis]RAL20721.1 cob(I)yrinic acid a,c-diamide adenosyltransferase [Lujinxingia litoralis]